MQSPDGNIADLVQSFAATTCRPPTDEPPPPHTAVHASQPASSTRVRFKIRSFRCPAGNAAPTTPLSPGAGTSPARLRRADAADSIEQPSPIAKPISIPIIPIKTIDSTMPATRSWAPGPSPARRRRAGDDSTEQTSPSAMDTIDRLRIIIRIAEPMLDREERSPSRELLKAIQIMNLEATGKLPHHLQKRRRSTEPVRVSETAPVGSRSTEISEAIDDGESSGSSSSSVRSMEEAISAIERMCLSDPTAEGSPEYVEVLEKLKGLLRTEKDR